MLPIHFLTFKKCYLYNFLRFKKYYRLSYFVTIKDGYPLTLLKQICLIAQPRKVSELINESFTWLS